MDWEILGFKCYPFSVNPISMKTIDLFTGHDKAVDICKNMLTDNNLRIIIEGSRGVGTTSFANYLKFSVQKKKLYLAPRVEVSVEAHWNLESLLIAIISNIVREMELTDKKVVKNKIFIEAKALSYRLSEAYNNFGVTAFCVGGSYGKSSSVSQPSFIPSTTLGHHLQDLGKLAVKLGYKNGILVQLNNLDLNIVHSEEHLLYLFNAARDFFQIENISWLLVGDVGISSFVASKVDRLDDIISDKIFIKPLSKVDYRKLIKKRIDSYSLSKKSEFPLNQDVFDYLYDITDGRLRYVFGLIYSLLNRLQIGRLVQKVSLDLARDTIIVLSKERLEQFSLSNSEKKIICFLAINVESNVISMAKGLDKNRTFISKLINNLLDKKCVLVRKDGKQRFYSLSLDAKIAFSDTL